VALVTIWVVDVKLQEPKKKKTNQNPVNLYFIFLMKNSLRSRKKQERMICAIMELQSSSCEDWKGT
jgi:hypothetical protein